VLNEKPVGKTSPTVSSEQPIRRNFSIERGIIA